jgi:hypothetical protein
LFQGLSSAQNIGSIFSGVLVCENAHEFDALEEHIPDARSSISEIILAHEGKKNKEKIDCTKYLQGRGKKARSAGKSQIFVVQQLYKCGDLRHQSSSPRIRVHQEPSISVPDTQDETRK